MTPLTRGRGAPNRIAAAVLVLATLLGPACRARAETAPDEDPFSMLKEGLTVTAATKRPQPLSETPSSVSIITAAEIQANGYHNLGEALRWVRGLYVTNDRNYLYVGVRGVMRPGDYDNKVLVAVDGHTLNGIVYGDASFGEDLGIDMERVERIEVVRGPSSSLYGGFAALAVINVVLRDPHHDAGVSVTSRIGAGGEKRGYFEIASARAGRPEWSLSGSLLDGSGADLYFPAYDDPLTHFGRSIGSDGERAGSLLGEVEWNRWRLTAKLNQRLKRVPTGSFGTRFGDPRNRTYDGRDFVELTGVHPVGPALELTTRAYWDGARYHGYYLYGPDSATTTSLDRGDGDLVGAEVRANWSPGAGNVVTLGLEGQRHVHVHMLEYDLEPYHVYFDRDVHRSVGAAYAQDELRIGRSARLTAGARVDGDLRYLRHVISPRLDLVWSSSPATTWKLLAGTAFRPPSLYESEFDDGYSQVGNPRLSPERVATVEGVLDRRGGPFLFTLSAYASRIRDLIDLVTFDSLGATQYQNRARVNARGVEGELQAVAADGLRARLAIAAQRSEDAANHSVLSNSPAWNAQLVLTRAPETSRTTLGAGVRLLSPRVTLAGNRTKTALVADARIGWRVGTTLLAGFEVKNLADARYGDPASRELREDEILQDPRTFYLTLGLHRGSAR